MPVICKYLDLSNLHLDQNDQDYLDYAANHGAGAMTCGKTEYGWFVYAPEDPSGYRGLTDNLKRIFGHATEHDCAYVLFDADADVDPALPIFQEEWT